MEPQGAPQTTEYSEAPTRVIVPDGPHAKTRFDNYIDELQVKAKVWDKEDRAGATVFK